MQQVDFADRPEGVSPHKCQYPLRGYYRAWIIIDIILSLFNVILSSALVFLMFRLLGKGGDKIPWFFPLITLSCLSVSVFSLAADINLIMQKKSGLRLGFVALACIGINIIIGILLDFAVSSPDAGPTSFPIVFIKILGVLLRVSFNTVYLFVLLNFMKTFEDSKKALHEEYA